MGGDLHMQQKAPDMYGAVAMHACGASQACMHVCILRMQPGVPCMLIGAGCNACLTQIKCLDAFHCTARKTPNPVLMHTHTFTLLASSPAGPGLMALCLSCWQVQQHREQRGSRSTARGAADLSMAWPWGSAAPCLCAVSLLQGQRPAAGWMRQAGCDRNTRCILRRIAVLPCTCGMQLHCAERLPAAAVVPCPLHHTRWPAQ